jgi:hypothetical protein
VFFNKLTHSPALRFAATGAPPAAKRTRILPMIQHTDNIWNEGKFLLLFTCHRRCWKRCPSTRKYLSQLIDSLKTHVQQSFLHLQDTRHQLSLNCFSNCVVVLALDFDTPVSWGRRFRDFISVCSSVVPMLSKFSVSTRCLCLCFLSITSPVVIGLFTKLWIVCWELFHHKTYVQIFTPTFQQICISRRCHTEICVALKYIGPCRGTLLTNC